MEIDLSNPVNIKTLLETLDKDSAVRLVFSCLSGRVRFVKQLNVEVLVQAVRELKIAQNSKQFTAIAAK